VAKAGKASAQCTSSGNASGGVRQVTCGTPRDATDGGWALLNAQVAECISSFLKKFKSQFLPYLDQLMPQILPLLQPNRAAEERCVAICIFDDIVEHANETGQAVRYFEHFMPALLGAYKDDNCDVRQAVLYGFGVLAQFGGDPVKPAVPDLAAKLIEVITLPESRTGDNEVATDNAVSALGKVIQYQRSAFDPTAAMSTWLSYLPVKGDKEEAQIVHEALVRMVETGDALLVGASQENLPHVVKIFSQVVNEELMTDEVKNRVRALMMSMQTNLQPPQVAAIWGALSPEEQAGLQMFMQAPAASPPPAQ
ncbi:Importin-5, partial [Cymbomonas tetramitiformis]